ncbi:MAG TPA: ATP-binding cassette domain-containing protein [Candidatus Dormibacteraeota bacterium]|nr:ATP-binding cassette domain-containing protein [Candidatus Dormibacteraeota bacterium]
MIVPILGADEAGGMTAAARAPRSSRPAIEPHDIRRSFGRRKNVVEAVRGVDLRVEAGEIFGFLGPNGAGKTTTLRMLATLLPPSAGEATVAGADLRREPARVRERIGYVPQGGSTDPTETGRRELVIQGRLHGMDATSAKRRAAEVLDSLDLADAADRAIRTYSGGMKRRLEIGLGMMHRPEVLFLDEPTTGLDPQARARMWDEIRRLRSQGTTVFLTTHYLEEADALADRLAIIDQGRIVAQGTPDELKRHIAGDVVTLGIDGAGERVLDVVRMEPYVREASIDDGLVRLYVDEGESAVPRILRTLDAAGLAPHAITLARPSLDDVFLRETGRSLREEAA